MPRVFLPTIFSPVFIALKRFFARLLQTLVCWFLMKVIPVVRARKTEIFSNTFILVCVITQRKISSYLEKVLY